MALRKPKSSRSPTKLDVKQLLEDLETNLHHLEVMDIFREPHRIFITSDASLQFVQSTGKVIGIGSARNIYDKGQRDVQNCSISCLSCFSAAGEVTTPMVVYPYQHVPSDVSASAPAHFLLETSENGIINAPTFHSFVSYAFIPWISNKDIKKPVLLFVEGQKMSVTMQVSSICEKNGIVLYSLPLNATEIMEISDSVVLEPLKYYCKKEFNTLQRGNTKKLVSRTNFAPMFNNVLQRIPKSVIKENFYSLGLCPLTVTSIDSSQNYNNTRTDDNHFYPKQSFAAFRIQENCASTYVQKEQRDSQELVAESIHQNNTERNYDNFYYASKLSSKPDVQKEIDDNKLLIYKLLSENDSQSEINDGSSVHDTRDDINETKRSIDASQLNIDYIAALRAVNDILGPEKVYNCTAGRDMTVHDFYELYNTLKDKAKEQEFYLKRGSASETGIVSIRDLSFDEVSQVSSDCAPPLMSFVKLDTASCASVTHFSMIDSTIKIEPCEFREEKQ